MATPAKSPLRGQIWFVQLPVDPPEKGRRPVIIVSLDARNRHERADTVLVIPLSTSVHRANHPTHLLLAAGETGLSEDSMARAEDVTVVRKANLIEPRFPLRAVSHRRICELSQMVRIAMGCF
jgi:mRNA-degrading endonuclease toxin of MazEF toxin-antitoxin module